MKKLILILCIIFMFGCNNHEYKYKGIVTNKETNVTCRTIIIYNAALKIYTPLIINDKDYILIVKDSLNNENKYIVVKKTYDKINIGDKYFK